MPRKPKTAKDFPPEFLDAWKLAIEGKLMLTVESTGMARNLIQRLYTFRKRMYEEAPEMAAPWMLVDLRVHDSSGNIIVGKSTNVPGKAIIRPVTLGWKEQLRQQVSKEGVVDTLPVVPQLPATGIDIPRPLEGDSLVSQGNGDALSATLSDLGYSTEESK